MDAARAAEYRRGIVRAVAGEPGPEYRGLRDRRFRGCVLVRNPGHRRRRVCGGRPAARMGDNTAHGGVITLGCPTVIIGG